MDKITEIIQANPTFSLQIGIAILVFLIFWVMHFIFKTVKGIGFLFLYCYLIFYGISGAYTEFPAGVTRILIMYAIVAAIGVFGILRSVKRIFH